MPHARRGVSPLVSTVFYMGAAIIAIGIALNIAAPTLERMQDTSAIQHSIEALNGMDGQIRDVATSGVESARVTTLRFGRGTYRFNATSRALYYEIETTSPIIAKNRSRDIGAVRLVGINTSTGQERTVRVVLTYDRIALAGFPRSLPPGTYRVGIENDGVGNGHVNVTLSVR